MKSRLVPRRLRALCGLGGKRGPMREMTPEKRKVEWDDPALIAIRHARRGCPDKCWTRTPETEDLALAGCCPTCQPIAESIRMGLELADTIAKGITGVFALCESKEQVK